MYNKHSIIFFNLSVFVIVCVTRIFCNDSPLILTPLIENGELELALLKSTVEHPEFGNVQSYSGFLTVDKSFNSNLYFWYFPAEEDIDEAPLLLWLQGDPDYSFMSSLFTENGPFEITNESSLEKRQYRWTRNNNVLCIDTPVGTGYSFTNDGGYSKTFTETSKHLYEALEQFYTLFPSLRSHKLFLGGELFGGKYVSILAKIIHDNNLKGDFKMNLKGLVIANGIIDPINQVDYADYLYYNGMIDSNVAVEMKSLQQAFKEKIENKEWASAFVYWGEILFSYQSLSGTSSLLNYLESKDGVEKYLLISNFIQRPDIRAALHVGDGTKFSFKSTIGYDELKEDLTQSVAPILGEMLSFYRVLIYNGQLNIIVNYPATVKYLQKLEFSGSDEYKKAERRIWLVDYELAGYVKVAGNLTEVLVRKAGHMVAYDQPKWAYDLIGKFMCNIEIV